MKAITAAQRMSQLQFGLRVRKYRSIAQLTQESLAQRSRLYRSYIGRIESGYANPSLVVVVALAHALSVPIGALMDES